MPDGFEGSEKGFGGALDAEVGCAEAWVSALAPKRVLAGCCGLAKPENDPEVLIEPLEVIGGGPAGVVDGLLKESIGLLVAGVVEPVGAAFGCAEPKF